MKALLLFAVTSVFTISLSAEARNVRLPNQTHNVCVGKQKRVLQSRTQVRQWGVHNRFSRQRTFYFRGRFANLRFDTDEASVIARCRQPGSQTFPIAFTLNFNDRNTYRVNVTVNCVICIQHKVNLIKIKVRQAIQALRNPELNPGRRARLAQQKLNKARQLLRELQNQEGLSRQQQRLIRQLQRRIANLQRQIAESGRLDRQTMQQFRQIMQMLDSLAANRGNIGRDPVERIEVPRAPRGPRVEVPRFERLRPITRVTAPIRRVIEQE